MSSFIPRHEYAADTMGLVLLLEKRRMGKPASTIFQAAYQQESLVYVPSLVLAEILYLSERRRILATLDDLAQLFINFPAYQEAPLNFRVIRLAAQIQTIPELHDRLITATALAYNAPLITNAPKI